MPPGHLPNPGIEPASLTSPALAAGSLPLVPIRSFRMSQFRLQNELKQHIECHGPPSASVPAQLPAS